MAAAAVVAVKVGFSLPFSSSSSFSCFWTT
jgi:hypothetical protein